MRIAPALLIVTVLFIVTVLSAAPASAQMSDSALQGVWNRVEQVRADGIATFEAQPGMRIFMNGYYSWVYVTGDQPRPRRMPQGATPEQRAAIWGQFDAESGSYEATGNTVTTRAMVAKDPDAMASGVFITFSYRISGDTLSLTQVETQAGPRGPGMPTGKYVRVK